jgi:putative endonuclease
MMEALVYILFSETLNEYYTGYTKLNANERLTLHILETFKKSHTSQVKDWVVFYTINCESVKQAILIEKHIKKMKSRKYIQNLKKYNDITTRLLKRYM